MNLQVIEQGIIQFINNPNEEQSEKIYEDLEKLCKIQYQSNIAYSSSSYCALSGEELKENSITIENHSFSPNNISSYYLRDGTLDVSIGDITFTHYDGLTEEIINIELTWDILKQIYGDNLEELLEESYNHFKKRLDHAGQQTEKSGFISEQMNGQQVFFEQAHYNQEINQYNEGKSQNFF